MSYTISDIRSFSVEDYPYYYCDANVWIAALKHYCFGSTDSYELPYQKFIADIVNLNETKDPNLIKNIKNKPKIILSSLVLSEIINSFMRNVAMKTYFGGNDEYKRHNYKKEYRDNPSSDYKRQLTNLCTDIASFEDYTKLENDDFMNLNPCNWLMQLSLIDADFNDFYYFQYLKGKNIPFVTSDKDFKFQNIPIITASKNLLGLV
jgi:hypothetical protein